MSSQPNSEPTGLQQVRQRLVLAARQALRSCRSIVRHLGPILRASWQMLKTILRTILQIALALLILLEEWGWRPLADLLGRLARWRPWTRLENAIAQLPPYAALFVFVVPSALLLPLKFLALFLIAKGQLVLAALLFAGAKVVATALVARLFMLTQPALMQIGWFAWAYDTVMPWKEALVERVRASWVWRAGRVWKERAKRIATAYWRRWRPAVREATALVRAAAHAAAARLRRAIQGVRTRWSALQR
jgi:hypothetical protein